jgi:hypothetical protein
VAATVSPGDEGVPDVLEVVAPLEDEIEVDPDDEDVDDDSVDVVVVALPVEPLPLIELAPPDVEDEETLAVDAVDEESDGAQRALWQLSPTQQSASFWQ